MEEWHLVEEKDSLSLGWKQVDLMHKSGFDVWGGGSTRMVLNVASAMNARVPEGHHQGNYN